MTYQVQYAIPYYTGIPTDVVTNTFHFDWLGGGTPTGGDLTALKGNLVSFYSYVFNNTTGRGSFASWMRPANTIVKMFNLSDPKPRVPVLEEGIGWAISTDTASILPTETAAVLSYHTEYESGIAKGSQRGRIYLGGLGERCYTVGTTTAFSQPSANLRTCATAAAVTLFSDCLADNWGWVVYSPKLDQSFAVAGGYMDNAFDTQRRRGQAPTVRLPFVTP